MEKPSGLKECPRCGLRNRPGAYQCEFCGWDFGVASDDWMGQISDLEKLGQEIDAPSVDESTASKIEMTMKKPAEVQGHDLPPVADDVPLFEELDLGGTAAVAKPIYDSAIPSDDTIAEAIPDPYVGTGPERPKAKAKLAAAEAEPAAGHKASFKLELPFAIDAALLVAGIGCLAAALLLVTSGSLDKPVGWIVSIVGAFLAVLGISRLLPELTEALPSRKKGKEAEPGN